MRRAEPVELRDLIVRPATEADLDSIRSIARSYGTLARWPRRPDYLDHELRSGTVTVGEEQGKVAGYGGVIERNGIAHLADLFVRPDRLGVGIGRAILGKTLPVGGERVTFASRDPRALPLYIKFGMLPVAPLLYLTGSAMAAKQLPDPGVTLLEGVLASIAPLDRNASGRDRLQDLEFLHSRAGARGFLAVRGKKVIGYGFCRLAEVAEDNATWAFLGPLGAPTWADALQTLIALLRWSAEQAAEMTVPVFGPNAATHALLAVNFQIEDMDTFMASRDGLFDLDRYFPSIELG